MWTPRWFPSLCCPTQCRVAPCASSSAGLTSRRWPPGQGATVPLSSEHIMPICTDPTREREHSFQQPRQEWIPIKSTKWHSHCLCPFVSWTSVCPCLYVLGCLIQSAERTREKSEILILHCMCYKKCFPPCHSFKKSLFY